MSKKKKTAKKNSKMAYMEKKVAIANIMASKRHTPQKPVNVKDEAQNSISNSIKEKVDTDLNLKQITVKNAEDDPDTTATILVQNQIDYVPKVSVIMPVYNVEPYLRQCLDSVVNQTLREIEIICVDDGSTDNSLEILKEYAKKDKRIIIATQKNSGSGKARNFGIDTAKGEFIAFMDSDDMYPNEHTLNHLYTAAIKNKVQICGGSLMQLKDEELISDPSKFEEGYCFKKDGPMEYKDYQFDYGYWRFIYDRKFLNENKIYFPDYLRQQDPPFFVKTMAIGKGFYGLKEPTYVYRVSHKEIKWTERKAIDVVKALIDILKYTKTYNLDKLHYIIAQRLVNPWFLRAFKLLTDKDENILFLEKLLVSLDYRIIYKLDPNFSLTFFYKTLPNVAKVSIIVPVYNVEAYLCKCLDSVINQTYKNIEIICINDGSTDGSLKILEQYARRDKRITVISQENQGLPNARNTGLLHCNGDFIMFLDSDDWLDLNYTEVMYKKMIESNADIVKSGYKHYVSDTNVEDDYINKIIEKRCAKNENLKIWENNVTVWATLYKKSFLIGRDVLLFDRYILKHEDILYTLKITTLANKIIPVSGVYYNYRRTSSILSTFNSTVFKIYPIITDKAVDFLNKNIFIDKESYINIVQRLVWRLLDAYKKLEKMESFDNRNLSIYEEDIKKIFAKIEYKKEVFSAYQSTLNKINSQELYSTIEQESKRALVIEINDCHGECLPGYIKYLQDLGHIVDVLVNEKQKNELPLYMFDNVNVNYASEKEIINFLNGKALEKYKLCLFNSNVVYNQEQKSIFKLFNNKGAQTKFLCVEHRLENLRTLSQKAICIILKNFGKRKLAYEVNPHYFGNIVSHKKNKIVNFIVVGNIDGRRKNYSLLTKAIERLHHKGIENFKVTVVGKGNVLDIPEDIRSCFDIKGRLSYPDMYSEMQKADYFLPLLDPKNNEHERYIKTGTSGSFQLIYGFNIPCLIAKKFAKTHGFNEQNSIIYKNNDDFLEALICAIKQAENDYKKMQHALSVYAEALYNSSLDNLKSALNAKISKKWFYFSYLLFPYYATKIVLFRKTLLDHYVGIVKKQLRGYRIDIRNTGNTTNNVNVSTENAVVSNITWHTDHGRGKYIQGHTLFNLIKLKVTKAGILQIDFRGQDKFSDSKRFPLWIDYKSIKIDGKEILSEPIPTWHDKPFHYEMKVNDGQEIILDIKQQYHQYSENELKNVILKLNSNNSYINDHISEIIKNLKKHFLIVDEATNQKLKMQETIRKIWKDLTTYRLDIKNIGLQDNSLEIIADKSEIEIPKWFTNNQGIGKIIRGNILSDKFQLKIINDGLLQMAFRGQDYKYENKRFPVWIDYKSIKVDGKEILSGPITTWHDKPYSYEMSVKDGQEMTVEVEQQYHEYTQNELRNILLRLYASNNDIDLLIDELKKQLPIIDEETKRKIELEKLISTITDKTSDEIKLEIAEKIFDLKNIKILSKEDTIKKIREKHLSVARYGDGEINWMITPNYKSGFQKWDEYLSQRLKEIFLSNNNNLILCLSEEYNNKYTPNEFWKGVIKKTKFAVSEIIPFNYTLGNTNITRDARYVPLMKEIWQDKDIVIVEGRLSRLGVGNDLFDNVKSLKRILCPAENAFDRYDEILSECKKQPKDKLFLLALGPTATILAYDLANLGYWALDVGHIDVVYEWKLRGGNGKVAIPGKYVNEVAGGRSDIENCTDPVYLNQIIAKVI